VRKEQGYEKDKGDGPEVYDHDSDTTNDDKTALKMKSMYLTPDNERGKKSHLTERRLEGSWVL